MCLCGLPQPCIGLCQQLENLLVGRLRLGKRLQLRNRVLAVLAACCIAGVAIYGALTLLRELAGLLTTLALVLLTVAIAWVMLRTTYLAGKAALHRRRGGKNGGADTIEAVVKRE